MSNLAIRVENLGKLYQIGRCQRYGTLRDALMHTLCAPFRNTGPYGANRQPCDGFRPPSGSIWAISDVSFEVRHGEIIGIIGRNGAGKSTLLKILSRITEPTTGEVEIRGRVGSLLEVGTGFHPELTGRENVYLNGAILGMKKAEIERKFDEIVGFAEIEKFLDTPVKYYSSGMYMRLAFSVAAHLDPEILVVDEVLAVGDAQFQKKCLGKMDAVSRKEGRTVLFVSHNMGSILHLCDKALLLENGHLTMYSDTKRTVNAYLTGSNPETHAAQGVFIRAGFNESRDLLKSAELLNGHMERQSSFKYGEPLNILIHTNQLLKEKFGIELRIKNSQHHFIAYVSSWVNSNNRGQLYAPGDSILIHIPHLPFVQGIYYIDFICRLPRVYHVDNWWDSVSFDLSYCRPEQSPVAVQERDQLGSVVLQGVTFTRTEQC